MPLTILAPLDGSALSEEAVPYAVRLTQADGTRLVLARVVATTHPHDGAAGRSDARTLEEAKMYLDRVADGVRCQGLSVDVDVLRGDPSTELVSLSSRLPADVVVMATHGRTGPGRWVYGSVADELLRHVTTPILLVPDKIRPAWSLGRAPKVLVTVDGSQLSEEIVQPLERLSALRQADVVLLLVIDWPPCSAFVAEGGWYDLEPEREVQPCLAYLDEVGERLRPFVNSVVTRVELGRMPLQILEVAREECVDLIAMATHGRSGLGRLVLGSTATVVVQRAERPVLLVRPPTMRQPWVAPEPAASTSSVTVHLTRPELVLIQRGLNALSYRAALDDQKHAAVEQLRDRCREQEAVFMQPVESDRAEHE
jgi:nucleotide-binding universal stress UspA family protein